MYTPCITICVPSFSSFFAAISVYSNEMERLQKRVLQIIQPDLSYAEALVPLDITSLYERRKALSWGGGGGKLLSIHSLKRNPNDVLTTCKAISKGLASGFVY